MKKPIFYLTIAFAIAASLSMASCHEDPVVPDNGEDNTTDVAVTGSTTEMGATYAKIGGVVNLNFISAAYTSVEIGVEVSFSQDFMDKERFTASGVVGRTFSVLCMPLTAETKYFYRTYVSVSSLSFDYYGETLSFTTKKMEDAERVVDLGLPSGTVWATVNVGANSPEECGDYFAWGEKKRSTGVRINGAKDHLPR